MGLTLYACQHTQTIITQEYSCFNVYVKSFSFRFDVRMKVSISREHVEAAVGVVLRVPALFILEAWYKTDPDKLVQDTTKDTEVLSIAVYYGGR